MNYLLQVADRVKNVLRIIGMVFMLIGCPLWGSAQTEYSLETVPNVRLYDRFNHVSNPDHILSNVYVDSINYVLNALEDSTGIEVAVVAVTAVGDNDVRLFASDLFNRWGIGKKGKDNGLLVMLVTEPSQRAVVFETGYGIEGILPDATCFRIQQDYMLPDMKEEHYGLGMYKGIKQVVRHLNGDIQVPKAQESEEGDWVYALILFLILAPIIIFFAYLLPIAIINLSIYVIVRIVRKLWPKKCPICHKHSLKLQHEKIQKWPTFKKEGSAEQVYVCKHCGHKELKKRTIQKISYLGYFSGGSSSGSSRHGGGSWGGGSSGGGGSISRF